jgi:hypothetical protein
VGSTPTFGSRSDRPFRRALPSLRRMEMMKVAVGSKRPIPVFSPNARDLPDGSVVEDNVVFVPLPRAAKRIGHKDITALHMAIRRGRVPLGYLRQRLLPDGCRIYISESGLAEYIATKAFRRGRPKKKAV